MRRLSCLLVPMTYRPPQGRGLIMRLEDNRCRGQPCWWRWWAAPSVPACATMAASCSSFPRVPECGWGCRRVGRARPGVRTRATLLVAHQNGAAGFMDPSRMCSMSADYLGGAMREEHVVMIDADLLHD